MRSGMWLLGAVSVEAFVVGVTGLLIAGLVLSVLLRGRPARAHRALVLSMVVGLLLVPLGFVAHGLGWGVLPDPNLSSENEAPVANGGLHDWGPRPDSLSRVDTQKHPQTSLRVAPSVESPEDSQQSLRRSDGPSQKPEGIPGVASGESAPTSEVVGDSPEGPQAERAPRSDQHLSAALARANTQEHPRTSSRGTPEARVSETGRAGEIAHEPGTTSLSFWRLALWGWPALSALALMRFLVALVRGARLLQRARPCHDAAIQEALEDAAKALGLRWTPTVYASDAVRSPVIWSWRLHPALLVPDSFIERVSKADWRGVLCHELAHVKRRDHWAALISELLLCLVPWHLLVWFAKRRLAHLSELACDDWALASGQDGTQYADSLVSLAPQRRPILAPSAATSRSGLKRRIERVLAGRPGNPRLGVVWSGGLALLFGALALVAAMTQSCAPEGKEDSAESRAQPSGAGPEHAQNDDRRAGESEEAVQGESSQTDPRRDQEDRDEKRLDQSVYLLTLALREGYANKQIDSLIRNQIPAETAFSVLEENWHEAASDNGKLQAMHAYLRARKPPRVIHDPERDAFFSPLPRSLEILNLGANDPSHQVRMKAFEYLSAIAFRRFGGDQEYRSWYDKWHKEPMEEILLGNCADFVPRLREADAYATEELTGILARASDEVPILQDVPDVGQRLVEDGILDVYGELIRAGGLSEVLLDYTFRALRVLPLDEAFLAEVVYPICSDESAQAEVRDAVTDLLMMYDRWFCRLRLEAFAEALDTTSGKRQSMYIGQIVNRSYNDPVVVPPLISALEADAEDKEHLRRAIGAGLKHLTGVPVDPSHDGAWWRRWWEENRGRFDPEIAAMEIPEWPLAAVEEAEETP